MLRQLDLWFNASMTQFVKISLVVALAFSWAYAAEAMADVYGYTDEVGAINLTDNPVNEDYVLLAVTPPEPVAPVLASLPSTFTSIESKPLEANTPYLDVINNAAETSGVEGRLLHAVITAESNYNPKALSPKGAQGLMQLMPRTATNMAFRTHLILNKTFKVVHVIWPTCYVCLITTWC